MSEFDSDLRVPGNSELNSELEKAGRVADCLEVGELMCYDALTREESCGAHFREEYQTPDGEAARNDNTEACQVECPQEISVLHIAHMNWEYNRALLSQMCLGAEGRRKNYARPKDLCVRNLIAWERSKFPTKFTGERKPLAR